MLLVVGLVVVLPQQKFFQAFPTFMQLHWVQLGTQG